MDLDKLLTRGVAEVINRDFLKKKLQSGQKLRIKMGFDPTKPDLHLGHVVGLRILQKLQEMGHTIIFLVGDYTARIGDPSGKNITRPVMTEEEIKENTNTYFNQVGKILDTEKSEIHCNSEWFAKFKLSEILKLMADFTVAQIIERDDFQKRIKMGRDIGLHEMLYPLMQAYDSVVLKADVEFGGTDQKFNMLAGRSLQKKMGQTPQDIVMVKLLIGLDGKEKMSKSLGNYIALNDNPNEMYGKVMSIPDKLIYHYYELCTDVTDKGLAIIQEELKGSKNPRDIKAELAKLIVETYHSVEAAEEATQEFDKVFKERQKPSEISSRKVSKDKMRIQDLILEMKMASSSSEARRLVEQGAVEVDEEKIADPKKEIEIKNGMVVKVGKRNFVKLQK